VAHKNEDVDGRNKSSHDELSIQFHFIQHTAKPLKPGTILRRQLVRD
jgi:hypothetical protein